VPQLSRKVGAIKVEAVQPVVQFNMAKPAFATETLDLNIIGLMSTNWFTPISKCVDSNLSLQLWIVAGV